MGNRAVITSVKKDLGVYVHWNGGPDSIGAFLDYCSLRGFRPPESDTYGYARLCQVLGNYFGADGLSVGIDIYTTDEQMDPGDNGIYVIEGWAIVERIGGYDYGSDGYDHDEMLRDIDKSQPEDQQLGAYLDSEGRAAREVSAGLGDRADRQPDFAGRDL